MKSKNFACVLYVISGFMKNKCLHFLLILHFMIFLKNSKHVLIVGYKKKSKRLLGPL